MARTQDAGGADLEGGFLPPQLYLPVLILLGYLAFLVTGFDRGLGTARALPLYIFFSLTLLVFQAAISRTRSWWRLAYIVLTSGYSIVYAGERVFDSAGNFTRSPYTYIVINILLVIVFLVDNVSRLESKEGGQGAWREMLPAGTRVYATLATIFAGFAVLFYVSALILDFLGPQNLLRALGLQLGPRYAPIDLNAALGLHLQAPLNLLGTFDIFLAFIATAITLLLFVILGALIVPQVSASSPTARDEARLEARGYGASLATIGRAALAQVSLSLRLVLGPLVWLVPAFSIAAFVQQIAAYLGFAATFPGATLVDLFNPLSKAGLESAGAGITAIGQGLLAILFVILSVVLVEQNIAVIQRAVRIFLETGRFLLLTWAFLLYSLAAINAALVLIGKPPQPEPFQVGAPGLIALLGGLAVALYASASHRATPPSDGARVPVANSASTPRQP